MREDILERLRLLRRDTRQAVESLTVLAERLEEIKSQLESPDAVLEYVDLSIHLIGLQADAFDRLVAEASPDMSPPLAARLRRFAASCEPEERRCREFNDRWVQKPLPSEEVRPLLERVVTEVRAQIARLRGLEGLATLAEASAVPTGDAGRYDRRALFTRLADPLRRRQRGGD